MSYAAGFIGTDIKPLFRDIVLPAISSDPAFGVDIPRRNVLDLSGALHLYLAPALFRTPCAFGQECKMQNVHTSCYAAIFEAFAGSVLVVTAPFRPFGKKPPCFTPAFPNVR